MNPNPFSRSDFEAILYYLTKQGKELFESDCLQGFWIKKS